MTVFAVKTEDEILKKDVTAYLYSNDKTDKLNCLFKSSMPDMPYISTVDFCSNVFKDTASEIKNDDGTYTVTLNNAAMVIDTENDTVYFDEFESFMGGVPVSEGTFLDSPYCKNEESVIEGKPKSITLDLGEYDIDILDSDGRSYFPVSTLSLLFVNTYNAAEYLGDSIYFIHSSDILKGKSYVDKTSVYENDHRSQEIIALTYNELCFLMDKYYGAPSRSEIAVSVREKGFDRTLDEYSDNTRRAKELILSDSKKN